MPVFDHAAGINLMPEQRELGIVFQSYAVWPHMTVAENVGVSAQGARRRRRPKRRSATARILEIVGLAAASDKGATALSGGQQQRVALARALVHEPRLVLFDEPMSNLDAQLRDQMRMELNVLQDRLGFTAIYVTHDQAEAFALAETVVVMNHGRIETVGEPRQVFHRPATPFVAQFLGLNVIRGRVVAARGEFFRVALADGVDCGAAPATPLAEGAAVLVCVRKEHVAVREFAAPAPVTDLPPPEQVFPADIRAASFLGLEEEYIVAIDGVEFGSIQPAHGFGAGERVEAVIQPADCVLFADASSGLSR